MKTSRRLIAAVLAMAFALAGPQALGLASADAGESDTPASHRDRHAGSPMARTATRDRKGTKRPTASTPLAAVARAAAPAAALRPAGAVAVTTSRAAPTVALSGATVPMIVDPASDRHVGIARTDVATFTSPGPTAATTRPVPAAASATALAGPVLNSPTLGAQRVWSSPLSAAWHAIQSFVEGAAILVRRSLVDAIQSLRGVETATDVNYESHVDETGTVIQDRLIPPVGVDPADYSDILKFSDCTDILVQNSTILGGQEDAIDAVRGSGYEFRDLTLVPATNGITMKGAIDGVVIENVTFATHGTARDMEFGQFDNYWYVGRPPTQNITIKNVNAIDGKPVLVVLWDATSPTIIDSNVKIVRVPKLLWWPYFVVRAIQTWIGNLCHPGSDPVTDAVSAERRRF